LEIKPEERQTLSDHVPETHLIRPDNLEGLVQRKREFVFKPLHGFAGHPLLSGGAVGRRRLRCLMTQRKSHVAPLGPSLECCALFFVPLLVGHQDVVKLGGLS
jgi:hypothetical protein